LSDGEPSDESTCEHHPSVLGGGLQYATEDEPESSDKDYQTPCGQLLVLFLISRGPGALDSLAVLRLNLSAANEAGIQPQKAPSKSELEMNPIQFPFGSSSRSMTLKKSLEGSTPAMTPRSYEAERASGAGQSAGTWHREGS
jgi:hypothetical protein